MKPSQDSVYDKKKQPCWADRIIFKKSEQVECIEYTSVESIDFSENRPVKGLYQIVLTKISEKAKEEI